MPKIIYKQSEIIEEGKPLKVIAFIRRKLVKGKICSGRVIISSQPTEVSEQEYSVLKGKFGDDIKKITRKAQFPEPMRIEYGKKLVKKDKRKKKKGGNK